MVAQQVRCQPTGCRNLFGNLTKSQLQNEERDKLNSAPPVFHCEAGGVCGNSGIAAEFNSFFVHLRWFGASAPGGGCALPPLSAFSRFAVWLLQRIGRLSKFLDSRDEPTSCNLENQRQNVNSALVDLAFRCRCAAAVPYLSLTWHARNNNCPQDGLHCRSSWSRRGRRYERHRRPSFGLLVHVCHCRR